MVSNLKPLVGNLTLLQSFNKYIDLVIAEHHKILEQSNDIITIHRAQGAIASLGKLKLLRDEVTGLDKK